MLVQQNQEFKHGEYNNVLNKYWIFNKLVNKKEKSENFLKNKITLIFRSSKSANNLINGKIFAILPEAYAPFDPIVDSLIKKFVKH